MLSGFQSPTYSATQSSTSLCFCLLSSWRCQYVVVARSVSSALQFPAFCNDTKPSSWKRLTAEGRKQSKYFEEPVWQQKGLQCVHLQAFWQQWLNEVMQYPGKTCGHEALRCAMADYASGRSSWFTGRRINEWARPVHHAGAPRSQPSSQVTMPPQTQKQDSSLWSKFSEKAIVLCRHNHEPKALQSNISHSWHCDGRYASSSLLYFVIILKNLSYDSFRQLIPFIFYFRAWS